MSRNYETSNIGASTGTSSSSSVRSEIADQKSLLASLISSPAKTISFVSTNTAEEIWEAVVRIRKTLLLVLDYKYYPFKKFVLNGNKYQLGEKLHFTISVSTTSDNLRLVEIKKRAGKPFPFSVWTRDVTRLLLKTVSLKRINMP